MAGDTETEAVNTIGKVAPRPVTLATDAIQPHMTIDDKGNIYTAFIERGNIVVQVSRDAGKSFSKSTVAIDLQGRGKGGAHRGPRIGVDTQGVLSVTAPIVLDESEYSKKYPTRDLVLVRSTDGGSTWTEPAQVNEVAKQAPEALHWMTVAPSGDVHIAWLDMRDRDQGGQDIYYATAVDGKVGANFKVASTVCECCAPGLAIDAVGSPIVAYREGGEKESREIFLRRSMDGQTFLDAVQINVKATMEHG